ncbi:sporulation initiation factor Spo0A C-terminal domain-containing protein [Lawsonibacter sp. OA9]|uniref:sporulation initiation factor Spo0A C-terminal domain-containing protein n=1 Tax=Oscillospiraceae TaxID=216572 RepID=UPI001F069EC4|nr:MULTISPECIES: sporulation initiation factor Spo0A C-terminal domain-containing protein [Oscillospiraceae]MCH1980923.1 sporulation initiation factor Spo0A C-terminal domain-containing protein [Lawsonibacter sp. OA9]MCH1984219.1 sporulation initiation factor Spo0A C-terminal domain-containing protein [Ruminococcus sp. OA3]
MEVDRIEGLKTGEVLLTLTENSCTIGAAQEYGTCCFGCEVHSGQGCGKSEQAWREKAGQLLLEFGVSVHTKGYVYLCQAVGMAAASPGETIWVTKEIYPAIAKRERATAAGVERAIRYAVTGIWDHGNWKLYSSITQNLAVSKPTNGQFILQVAKYLHEGMRM